MAEELSAIDIRILEQIQKDAGQSSAELAERVGLSQSPCWRRLQRLREEGYIKGQVALLNRKRFADTLLIFATLKMGSLTDEKRAEFFRKVEVTPEIMECHTIFGERDIMLKIVAQSLEWYQQFVFRVILKLPGVQDTHSLVTMMQIKESTAIPVRLRSPE
ncbi:Lrp/AsnC family transcriptional regulator [Sphingobium sp. AP50]|uniref:Lrp/AsnC family transcriptional regulator n=1 Tax=Sphingobium sp. AP50 TaxID=1884369 RepID=UPI0008BF5212|nr:Lrp/AsnC family transcriptional regulator [Sphingobium sp. AP50]SEJ73896.1 Lrp/AsnC family transcriptional regulator [Sphingobium sp. AP50]